MGGKVNPIESKRKKISTKLSPVKSDQTSPNPDLQTKEERAMNPPQCTTPTSQMGFSATTNLALVITSMGTALGKCWKGRSDPKDNSCRNLMILLGSVNAMWFIGNH